MRPRRWRPSAPHGHRRSPSPPRERPLPHPGPSRATARASPHSPARALARGAYQRPQGIAHTGMGNARMQGQQSQGRTAEGMAILGGGARRSQSRRLTAEACHSGRSRGPSVPVPYAAAKRPLWPSSRNVNCGVDQLPGYEGKKHRPLHRAAGVWGKRTFAAGTVNSRFSQRTGPATATARDTCARSCDLDRGGGAGSGARRRSGFAHPLAPVSGGHCAPWAKPSGSAQGCGVRAAAQTRGPGPFAS